MLCDNVERKYKGNVGMVWAWEGVFRAEARAATAEATLLVIYQLPKLIPVEQLWTKIETAVKETKISTATKTSTSNIVLKMDRPSYPWLKTGTCQWWFWKKIRSTVLPWMCCISPTIVIPYNKSYKMSGKVRHTKRKRLGFCACFTNKELELRFVY